MKHILEDHNKLKHAYYDHINHNPYKIPLLKKKSEIAPKILSWVESWRRTQTDVPNISHDEVLVKLDSLGSHHIEGQPILKEYVFNRIFFYPNAIEDDWEKYNDGKKRIVVKFDDEGNYTGHYMQVYDEYEGWQEKDFEVEY